MGKIFPFTMSFGDNIATHHRDQKVILSPLGPEGTFIHLSIQTVILNVWLPCARHCGGYKNSVTNRKDRCSSGKITF